jgi:hypothetical protein
VAFEVWRAGAADAHTRNVNGDDAARIPEHRLRPVPTRRPARPLGTVTRGTTNPNRLRRVDRWLAGPQAWRLRRPVEPPIVVDLGYGASPVTVVELSDRLRRVRPDIEVVGVEIDPARVESAIPLERPGLHFRHGGFEVPLDPGRRATIVRAFNVLRQYAEGDVTTAWAQVRERLTPDGLLVDGTCDELGRVASWVAVSAAGPVSLTISLRLRDLVDPTQVAERLPKALIHRNVPGEPVHAFLDALGRSWRRAAPHSAYGARRRFVATVEGLRDGGVAVVDGPNRWRLGELTVAWREVEPLGGDEGCAGQRV